MSEANPGRLHRVDPSVLDDDPFWSVVRRRHPDLDVVVLPDASTGPDAAGPPASVDEVRRAAVALQEAWRWIRPMLAEHGEPAPPSIRWQESAGQRSLVLKKAVTEIGQEAGTELLQRLVVQLGDLGWMLHPGGRDGLPVLRATDGQVAVEAIAGPGATVVTLTSVPLAVTSEVAPEVATEVAQAVLDDLRTEVASWE